MATYYVSPSGDDLAAGTAAGTAWKRMKRAEAQSPGANDTVYLTGTTTLVPQRSECLLGTTYRGNGTQYMLGTVDISEGATYGRTELTTHFQASTGWSLLGSPTPDIQSTTKAIGANAIRFQTVNAYIRSTISAHPGKFRVGFIYQCDSGNTVGVRIANTTGGTTRWLNQTTGAWQTSGEGGSSAFISFGTSTTWVEVVSSWFNGYDVSSNTRIDIGNVAGANYSYLNQFYVEHQSNWSLYSGTTYKTYLKLGVAATALFKSATWATDGADGLVFCTKGTDKDTLAAGEWVYDSTANLLYYKLASGEDITTLHLEVTDRAAAVYANAVSQVARDLVAYGYLQGFNSASTGTLTGTNLDAIKCVKFGFLAAGSSTMTLTDPYQNGVTGVDASTHGDGIFVQDTATLIAYRPISINADDDGFQCRDGSTMKLYNPVSYGNGGGCFETFSSFTGNYEVYDGTFYGDIDATVVHDNSATATARTQIIKGTVVYQGHATNDVVLIDNVTASAAFSNNVHYIAGTGTKSAGYTSTLADPLFVDIGSNDFRLDTGSPCYRVGLYNANAKTDVRGRRRPVKPSIGAYEPSAGDPPGVARTERS